MSFVFGAAGTRSSTTNPVPATYVCPLPVINAPNNKSPAAVVVAFPLLAKVPLPCAAAVTSSEFDAARPEYSRRAKRSVLLAIESDTVTVFAPPVMFSA